ncbi:MAG: MATE family efflux transporter [Roseburia sp.]|nr:MATE family efflux transporter [Roseburia sp.]
MKKKDKNDAPMSGDYLGSEKVGKLFAKFTVPCIASLIISCLYNIVDQIFLGHMGVGYGTVANAATGIVFPVTVVGWAFALLFGDGAAAYLSVALGKKRPEKIHKSVGGAMLGAFLAGCAVILIAYLWGDKLLMLLGADTTDAIGSDGNALTGVNTLAYSHDYSIIVYAMMPLALVQVCLASIIRADGSPLYALIAMVAGAVFNIAGDPIAIYALDLGVKGAAWATIIGQFISFLLCAGYLFKSKNFRLKLKSFAPDFKVSGRVLQLGLSSFMTQIFIAIITIVNNILLAYFSFIEFGETGPQIALAAFVVIMKLFQIILNVAIGLAAGAQPLVGYNYGAQKYDRVKKLLLYIMAWTAGICLFFTILFEAAPIMFIKMFSNETSSTYITFATNCIRIYLSLITFTCLQKCCAIFLQSIGKAKFAVPLSFVRDILLIIFSVALPFGIGVYGVFWGAPIADAIAAIATVPFMIIVWKQMGKMSAEAKLSANEPEPPEPQHNDAQEASDDAQEASDDAQTDLPDTADTVSDSTETA